MKYQPLLNFLFKFQKYLKDMKNDLVKKQNIDFNKTSLFKSILNLIRTLQDINFIKMLSIKNKSRDKCSDFVLNSIDYIQVRIFHLGLASIIKKNNDQTKRV